MMVIVQSVFKCSCFCGIVVQGFKVLYSTSSALHTSVTAVKLD
uniref:Uncharacterized protein n=1 Tax=Anguilla anguilla TaxID=7936 RepID=A0A0E9U4Z6_ANGAN